MSTPWTSTRSLSFATCAVSHARNTPRNSRSAARSCSSIFPSLSCSTSPRCFTTLPKVAADHAHGGGVEFQQQRVLPAVPQRRVGAAKIGDGEQVEVIEVHRAAHGVGVL